jgi:uncharacterized protein
LEISCKRIVKGKARGPVLLLQKPINFLGMANTKTGEITTSNDEQSTYQLKDKILVFPNSIGSSVGAYTIFALKHNTNSPRGMICTNKVDITTASGCAISNIPLAFIDENNYDVLIRVINSHSIQRNEIEIFLDTETETITFNLNKSL